MNIDDYLMGNNFPQEQLPDFQWHGSKVGSAPKPNLAEPFPSMCEGQRGNVTGKEKCDVCPNRHRDICLKVETTRMAGLGRSLVDKREVYTKFERNIMAELSVALLNGKSWPDLKAYLQSHYSKQDLIGIRPVLARWLSNPGILGHVLLDPDFFSDCRTAKEQLHKCKFKPIAVLQKERCIDCSHKLGEACARLGCLLYTNTTNIAPQHILNRVNELRAAGLISNETGLKCKLMSHRDPYAAMKVAVCAIGKDASVLSELDFAKSIASLGNIETRAALTFVNEPDDVKETKRYLTGGQMVVEVDPPTDFKRSEDDTTYYGNGSGIDGYLTY